MKVYYINQKTLSISDKYYIYDVNMQPFFEVTSNKLSSLWDCLLGNIISIGHTLNIKELGGNSSLVIKKKVGFFGQNYEIYNKNEKLASIHIQLKSFTPKVSIDSNKNHYLLKEDIFATTFSIYNKEMETATIKKNLLSMKDKYKVEIFDEANELLFLAIVLILDNTYHQ